jgi:effector-binding domain-containing protein
MITEFVNLPQIKALNLLFCGGDFEELKKMLYYIEDFARNAGIKRLYGGGRQGWIRKLKGLGFKQEYLISKDL